MGGAGDLDRIARLPDLPHDTAEQRVADADRQLGEIREAARHLVKREIDWTDAPEELRKYFDIAEVRVEVPDGGTAPLTGDDRRSALDRFAATLGRELGESGTAVQRREGLA